MSRSRAGRRRARCSSPLARRANDEPAGGGARGAKERTLRREDHRPEPGVPGRRGPAVWCARQALAEENRAQIERLSEASVLDVGLLAVLCLATVGINGLIFWATIRPVHRLSWAGAGDQRTSDVPQLPPFKLSVLARVLIHNRRRCAGADDRGVVRRGRGGHAGRVLAADRGEFVERLDRRGLGPCGRAGSSSASAVWGRAACWLVRG